MENVLNNQIDSIQYRGTSGRSEVTMKFSTHPCAGPPGTETLRISQLIAGPTGQVHFISVSEVSLLF